MTRTVQAVGGSIIVDEDGKDANGNQRLSPAVSLLSRQAAETPEERPASYSSEAAPLVWALDRIIKSHVLFCLSHFNGNAFQAAKALGVSKTTLYRWLKEWDVKR